MLVVIRCIGWLTYFLLGIVVGKDLTRFWFSFIAFTSPKMFVGDSSLIATVLLTALDLVVTSNLSLCRIFVLRCLNGILWLSICHNCKSFGIFLDRRNHIFAI